MRFASRGIGRELGCCKIKRMDCIVGPVRTTTNAMVWGAWGRSSLDVCALIMINHEPPVCVKRVTAWKFRRLAFENIDFMAFLSSPNSRCCETSYMQQYEQLSPVNYPSVSPIWETLHLQAHHKLANLPVFRQIISSGHFTPDSQGVSGKEKTPTFAAGPS